VRWGLQGALGAGSGIGNFGILGLQGALGAGSGIGNFGILGLQGALGAGRGIGNFGILGLQGAGLSFFFIIMVSKNVRNHELGGSLTTS